MMETVLYLFIDSMEALYFLFEKVVQGGMMIAFLLFFVKGVLALSTMELRYDYDSASGVGIYGKHPSERKNERGATLLSICIFIALTIVVVLLIQAFPEIRILLAMVGLVATFPVLMLWYAITINKTRGEPSSDGEPLYRR
jgi:hypothetical protein